MHTLQYIAVKAYSVEEACDEVRSILDRYLSEGNVWYDWFVVGGGRWASNAPNSYDEFTGDIAHQGDPRFAEYLDKAKKSRLDEIQGLVKEARAIDFSALLDSFEKSGINTNIEAGQQLFPIDALYHLSWGSWNCNSFFYDAEVETIGFQYLEKALQEGQSDWYLVPVDFHF